MSHLANSIQFAKLVLTNQKVRTMTSSINRNKYSKKNVSTVHELTLNFSKIQCEFQG